MAGRLNKLSTKFVETIAEPGRYHDGGGLYLQVTRSKSEHVTKAWLFRYMNGGKTSREMGLGPVSTQKGDGYTTLAQARKKRTAARELLESGVDPINAKNAKRVADRLEQAKAMTFKQCAEQYIAAHEAGWKSAKHASQWRATLETYAYDTIGSLPVAAVDKALVLKILKPIWSTKTETASRVRGRIESILDWARSLDLRQGDNPAAWRGHLEHLLPKRSQVAPIEHHAALPYGEMPAFMAKLRALDSISARALQWTILNAVRTGDTIGATFAEIDKKEKLWTVPAGRLKAKKGARKRDHVVPLSAAALEVLERLPRTKGEFIFPGAKENCGLSNMAMAECLKDLGYDSDKATVHGFRSTFRDWTAERTSYPNEMCELALAHTVSDKVEAAYRRGDMRERRRRLMEDWAEFCASVPAVSADNVFPMRAAT